MISSKLLGIGPREEEEKHGALEIPGVDRVSASPTRCKERMLQETPPAQWWMNAQNVLC